MDVGATVEAPSSCQVIPKAPVQVPDPSLYKFWLPQAAETPTRLADVRPYEAAHLLPEQIPLEHTVPHAPQFFGSLVVSTQPLPHLTRDPWHVSAHAPALHT